MNFETVVLCDFNSLFITDEDSYYDYDAKVIAL